MNALSYIVFALFPLMMAYAAVSDLLSMTISNRLSLILMAGFVVAAPLAGLDLETFGLHLLAGAIVLACGFACFAFGWVGGGDAKIAAVAAMWLGLANVPAFLVQAALFGGTLTILILTLRRRLLPAFALRQLWLVRLHDPRTGVPYGIALAAAALAIYPHSVWIGLVV